MQIFIKNSGKSTILDVDLNESIISIKKRYIKKRYIAKHKYMTQLNTNEINSLLVFIYQGQSLQDSQKTLKDYDIKRDSTIFLVIKMANPVQNENISNGQLQNFKSLLRSLNDDRSLCYINISEPLIDIEMNVQTRIFNDMSLKFLMKTYNKIHIFLFNPEYLNMFDKLNMTFTHLMSKTNTIDTSIYKQLNYTYDKCKIEFYIMKPVIKHDINIEEFKLLITPSIFDSLNILFHSFNHENHEYFLRKKANLRHMSINVNIRNELGLFNHHYISKLKNQKKQSQVSNQPNNIGGYYKEYINLLNGGKRLIRYGSRGGRYYIKGNNKVYLK